MSVENFMENGGKILKVNIIKKINGSNYIGGDNTRLVHLKLTSSNFGELEEDSSYSLIKPEKQDHYTQPKIQTFQNQHNSNNKDQK
jgi:hypothetical protein